MKIVLIGTGNVASVLMRKFMAAGHQILQVAGRNEQAAHRLASLVNCDYTTDLSALKREADIYLLAINDDAIEQVSSQLKLNYKFLVHTAGAVSKEVLKNATSHYGVFYPLQTITSQTPLETVIPIHVDANDEPHIQLLKELAVSISRNVIISGDDERLKLHTAAVCCNNFTNYIYTLAAAFCQKEKLDFNHLLPLIQETTKKIQSGDPWLHQTGPARRHDENTIGKHLTVLHTHEELKKVYQFLTNMIKNHQMD